VPVFDDLQKITISINQTVTFISGRWARNWSLLAQVKVYPIGFTAAKYLYINQKGAGVVRCEGS
jgi:hypothetical protein